MKQFFIILKVMWIIWVSEPFWRAVDRFDKRFFGPCCDNPNLVFHEGHGFSVSKCHNCGTSKTYPRAGF